MLGGGLVLLLLAACGERRAAVDLVNGYQLWAMSPAEIWIGAPDHTLLVGTQVRRVGIHGDLLIVDCGTPAAEDRQVCTGYTIVDTRSGKLEAGLSHAQAQQRVEGDLGLREISAYFTH